LINALGVDKPETCATVEGFAARKQANGPETGSEEVEEQGFTRSARRARITGSAADGQANRQTQESSKKMVDKIFGSNQNPISLSGKQKCCTDKFFKNQQPISVGVGRRVPRRVGCAEMCI
jgi:hypothetical protein